jgi:hypothetical protein
MITTGNINDLKKEAFQLLKSLKISNKKEIYNLINKDVNRKRLSRIIAFLKDQKGTK